MPAVLVLGVIIPVDGAIVKPAVLLYVPPLVPVNVGLMVPLLLQTGEPA